MEIRDIFFLVDILCFFADVVQSRSAQIGAVTLIGSGSTIGDHSVISNSVIGQECNIGRNVSVHGCYIWNNVIIEDDCKLNHAIVCDGVHLRTGVVLEPGVILSFKVNDVCSHIANPSILENIIFFKLIIYLVKVVLLIF